MEKNTVSIHVRKSHLVLSFGRTRPEDLSDIKHKLKYRPTSMKHHNQHISDMNVENISDVNYGAQLTGELLEKLFS